MSAPATLIERGSDILRHSDYPNIPQDVWEDIAKSNSWFGQYAALKAAVTYINKIHTSRG